MPVRTRDEHQCAVRIKKRRESNLPSRPRQHPQRDVFGIQRRRQRDLPSLMVNVVALVSSARATG